MRAKNFIIKDILKKKTDVHGILVRTVVSSTDNLCKQFEPRSGPTKGQVTSGSKLFDTLMIFLKVFFEKVDFEKNQQTTKNISVITQ